MCFHYIRSFYSLWKKWTTIIPREQLHLLNYSFPQFSELLRNINTHPEITLLQLSAFSFIFIFVLSVFSSRKRHFSGVTLVFSTLGHWTNDEWYLIWGQCPYQKSNLWEELQKANTSSWTFKACFFKCLLTSGCSVLSRNVKKLHNVPTGAKEKNSDSQMTVYNCQLLPRNPLFWYNALMNSHVFWPRLFWKYWASENCSFSPI